jgi:hypothetical protein
MANHRFHLKAQLQGWAFFSHLGEVLWSPRTLTLAALIAPVRKRSFLSTLYTKMMNSPRQARDKHRESSTQKRVPRRFLFLQEGTEATFFSLAAAPQFMAKWPTGYFGGW